MHEINDVAFVGVTAPAGETGLRPVGRRRPVHQPDDRPSASARSSGPDQVAEVWAGVASVFRDYGYRRLRHRARIKFLIADWGPERFREVLEKEYLRVRAARRPGAGRPARRRARPRGRAPAGQRPVLRGLRAPGGPARAATRWTPSPTWPTATASGRVRTTAEQKMVILDVPAGQVDNLVADLEAADLQVNPSPFRRQHDGVHRDRVLQAGDRGDEGARRWT